MEELIEKVTGKRQKFQQKPDLKVLITKIAARWCACLHCFFLLQRKERGLFSEPLILRCLVGASISIVKAGLCQQYLTIRELGPKLNDSKH